MNEPTSMREALEQIDELEESLRDAKDQAATLRKMIEGSDNHYTVPKGGTLIISEGTNIGVLSVSGGTVCHTVGEPIHP